MCVAITFVLLTTYVSFVVANNYYNMQYKVSTVLYNRTASMVNSFQSLNTAGHGVVCLESISPDYKEAIFWEGSSQAD